MSPSGGRLGPTADQRLMLRAALLSGAEGAEAWRAWRSRVDLEAIDRGSARLLPLLWFNLLENGVDDPWMPRIKGVYRHTWFGNQLRVRRLRRVQAALASAGVDVLVLKGIALANAAYPNPGLRPMDDMDLLVRPADVPAALSALAADGWTTPVSRPDHVLRVVHGVELQAPDGERLDLHGHLFQGSLDEELDARRWQRSQALELADGPLRVLEPTDQLLHVMVHGVESDPPAPRWLADALMIQRHAGGRIDWPRLVGDADRESRALALARAARQLEQVFGRERSGLPAEVLAALRSRAWTRGQRFEDRIAGGPRPPLVGYLVQRWVDWRRWRRASAARRLGFVSYLRLNWGLDSARQLPVQVVRRGWRTAREDLRRLGPAGRRADQRSGAR